MSRLFQGLFIEFVSNPSNGEDPFRLAIILFHRLSQTTDMNIDRSRSNESFSSPYTIEELIPVQYATGILDQETKQLEFFQGQFHRFATYKDLISGEVDFQRSLVIGGGDLGGGFGLRATQDGPDPGNHFSGAKGLGEVIVGSHFESDNSVRFPSLRCEHEDWEIGGLTALFQKLAKFHARKPGKHEIENDEVWPFMLEQF